MSKFENEESLKLQAYQFDNNGEECKEIIIPRLTERDIREQEMLKQQIGEMIHIEKYEKLKRHESVG